MSSKDIYESGRFASSRYAAGRYRGIGVEPEPITPVVFRTTQLYVQSLQTNIFPAQSTEVSGLRVQSIETNQLNCE